MQTVWLYLVGIASHVAVISLLAVRRWQLTRSSHDEQLYAISAHVIAALGRVVAVGTLALPYYGPEDPLRQCGARITCFFYAFKLLDLSLTKADDPPKLLDESIEDTRLGSAERARYVWLLLTEMRYNAFDIKVTHRERSDDDRSSEWMHRVLVPVFVTGLVYVSPTPQTKCLLLLCVLHNALEGLHTLLHPCCPNSCFLRPFTAATLGDFWTIHWHQSAVFLQSLAYKPGRQLAGRWLGVLAAFTLSGVWHGWASMPLVDEEHAVQLGSQVVTFFVMLGVGTLLERVVWGGRQGGMLQRVLVWIWSLSWAGWCFRTLECHSRIPMFRDDLCQR